MPRWLRRLAARSELHRAWLCGFNGCFEQHGVRYGPVNPYPGPVLPCPAPDSIGAGKCPPLVLIAGAAILVAG